MKRFYLLLIAFALLSLNVPAQQASDYFPDQTGFEWIYKLTPLDSLNQPITSQSFFRIDSFTTTVQYQDSLAIEVVSKEGTAQLIQQLPFTDTTYYHFAGTHGSEYVDVGRLELFLAVLDSVVADSNFSFVSIFKSFEDWYSTYRFDATINQKYNLLSRDTSLIFNNEEIPLRFEYNALRLNDDTLNTDIGLLFCKRFVRERGISYLFFPPPPLPPIPVPIAFFNDSIWIAENNWIVQSILPSTVINLSQLTGDIFTIPGIHSIITDEVTGINNQYETLENFKLSQNYPNPFNPETVINFSIAKTSLVKLKVYNILGSEVATLVNSELSPGDYNVGFDASNLPSGVYIYRLESGNSSISRKMLYLK